MNELTFETYKQKLSNFRYLVVSPIDWHEAADGSIWLNDLWKRDLLRHFDYLTQIIVLAPKNKLPTNPKSNLVRLYPLPPGLRFIDLPMGTTKVTAILRFPWVAAVAIPSVYKSDIVQSGVVGWPIPPGFLINPAAIFFKKPLVIIIESSFWRRKISSKFLARFMGSASEGLAKWSIQKAHLGVFTHLTYAQELGEHATCKKIVTPASWIDKTDVLTVSEAEIIWDWKVREIHFLVSARLVEEKGILFLLAALTEADNRGLPLKVDIIGTGPLRKEVLEASNRFEHVKLNLIDPVPYGANFFKILRSYQAVILPSITDEQPRIIYDAFSQAIPIIASNTAGHRESVLQDHTGLIFPVNDAEALVDTLASIRVETLRELGMSARNWVEERTHQAMHLERAKSLVEVLGL